MPVSIYSRYYNTDTFEVDGKLAFKQRNRLLNQQYSDSIEHTVIGKETLDQLAARYYGKEELWWRIADANPNRFPTDWRAGDVLVIPPIRIATRTPRR